MSEPTPAELEATGGMIQVEYGGQTYTCPANFDEADGSVLEAFDNMKMTHAVKALLSPEDFTRFRATQPKGKDYAGLVDAWLETNGLGSAGE